MSIKRMIRAMAALLCAACLSACAPLSVNLQQADEAVSLPLPEEQVMAAVVGDRYSTHHHRVTLYLISDDHQLYPVSRDIEVSDGTSLIEETVRALLSLPDRSDARNPFPEGCTLLEVERSGDTVVVNLSIEARSVESEDQLLWMRSVMAASLLDIEEIRHVNLLIAGQSEALMSLPAGVQSGIQTNQISAAARLSAEYELLTHHDGDTVSVERNAVIYYAARDGRYIAPVVQTVRLSSQDFITPLLEALEHTPQEDGWLASPLPRLISACTQPPEIIESESGEKMVRLAFDANLIAELEREGRSEWQLYAALTYTITGFVPEIDGLIVLLGDGQLTKTERGGQEIFFEDGMMRRSDFPDAVCGRGYTYMAAHQGGLVRLSRPLDQESAASVRCVLGELFRGVQPWESGVARIMPDGVSMDDVLGISVGESEAVINLSANFYRCCQSLNAQQERNLIYAFVNALTEFPHVRAVRFQIEGETVDYLVGGIFLRGALMRNIGIIR